jgi:hypothetical protein
MYYYNEDGIFSVETGKSYVGQKAALNRLQKEGAGAVFDETGQLIRAAGGETDVPEAAQDAPETEPADTEDAAEQTGSGTEQTQSAAEPTGNGTGQPEVPTELGVPYYVATTCDVLRVRSCPDPAAPVVGSIRETVEKRKYRVTKEKDGWGMVYVPQLGCIGWIALAYTKKV